MSDALKSTRPSSKRLRGRENWRDRAEEARTIAEQMKDSDARASMFEVAAYYEELAQSAERRRLAKER
jgi:hypothetical protein